jgi:hypothetical protein
MRVPQFTPNCAVSVFAFAVALSIFAVGPVIAQTNVGRILGKVIDPSGAPAPGCRVEAVNNGTKISQVVQTDELGLYVFPSLAAGVYDLQVESKGFRRTQELGVILDPTSERVIDFKLALGTATESVTVSAAIQQVQTTSGEVSSVIDNMQLSQIALVGRNYSQLLWLVPGSVATPVSTTGSATTNAIPNPFGLNLTALGQRINGIRSQSTEFTLDGARNIDQGTAQNQMMNPSSEAIQEVKVNTASYSAEFGGRAGSSVNVVTKTGTQQFHGTVFEYVRNNWFDARSFFTSTAAPPLHFNDFGWVIGGPVYIPKKWNTAKNKLFFFYSQEWKYDHEGTTNNNTVPTAAERQGNFQNSSLTAPVDPANGAPFPNKIVPASRFSANGPLLLTPIPLPNSALSSGHTYIATGENQTNPRQELLRGDYYISPNVQLTYRWTSDRYQFYDDFLNDTLGIPRGQRSRPGYITSLGLSTTISPTAYNSFTFSVDHNGIHATDLGNEIDRGTLGLTFSPVFPENGSRGFPAGQVPGPTVSIAGFTGYGAGQRAQYGEAYFFLRDGFSKVAGPHTFKFGFDIHHGNRQNDTYANDQGVVTFNTSATLTTKNAIADVLLGNFYTYQQDQADTFTFDRWWEYDFYAQDSWRVNRHLTVEAGLRYNLMPPYINAQGNNATFVPGIFNPANVPVVTRSNGAITPNTGNPYNGIAILGSSWPDAAKGRLPQVNNSALNSLFIGLPLTGSYVNKNDWSPRLGIAYDPFGQGKTAIRMGFGLFYDRVGTDVKVDLTSMPPFVNSANVYNGNIDKPGGGAASVFPSNLALWPLHLPDPTVMTWNFGVEQQILANTILSVAYVGTAGRHLFRTIDINQLPLGTLTNPANAGVNVNALRPYLGYADIDGRDDGDNSHYNSLQVKLSKRTRSGLSFGVNYTLSRVLDDTAGGVAQVTVGGSAQNNYNANADYGLSAFQRKHVFNFNYIYELPFFARSHNLLLRKAVGGWEVAGVTTFQSGAPNSVTISQDIAGIGTGTSRASTNGQDPNLPSGQRTVSQWFNTQAFLPAASMVKGQFGNTGRNILIGPGYQVWSMSMIKNLSFGERVRMQFRAESYNTFNHPNFAAISTTVGTTSFGSITAAGPGRILSFGLKLMF